VVSSRGAREEKKAEAEVELVMVVSTSFTSDSMFLESGSEVVVVVVVMVVKAGVSRAGVVRWRSRMMHGPMAVCFCVDLQRFSTFHIAFFA
jgi:hypothetical protein